MSTNVYGLKLNGAPDQIMGNNIPYDPFDDYAQYELMFCWLPRRCYVTDQLLCCTLAMRGRRIITGPGEPVIEDRWYHRNEYLIMLLKRI
jgi:hypothetical protein